jgi:hypothetical protein
VAHRSCWRRTAQADSRPSASGVDADIPSNATYHDAQSQRTRLREQLDLGDGSPEDLRGEFLIPQEGIAETPQNPLLSVKDLFVVAP